MYYPQNRDAEHRESERRLAEYDRRAEYIERFADLSQILIKTPLAESDKTNNEDNK
jgi:hypothetical protein